MGGIKIEGSVVFITGANRGIGKALVEQAVKLGAKKIYATARDTDKLAPVIMIDQGKIMAITMDVTKPEQIEAAAKEAQDTTIVINNAGVASMQGFITAENIAAARNEMEVNYLGALQVARGFTQILNDNGGGALINIISVAGLTNFPFAASYSASKAAAHSLTQGLRAELSGLGTYVAGVYPGPVDTDMAKDVPMEKASPEQVALNIYQAMAAGLEEIFPDPYAEQFAKAWKKDAKAVEQEQTSTLQ
ncbi:MAG: SDR family oxidoreductase [Candidatus Omnitrophota bacterium]|nr:SDR family oxidoreductase [Candidatus Omnitrophota bacterium]